MLIRGRGLACAPGEGQQGDVARLLDGSRQPVLVRSAYARQTARHDLAALGDELAEHAVVLIVDVFDFLDAELADLLAPEKFASTAAFARGRSPPGRGPSERGLSLGADCGAVSSAIILP